MPGQECIISLLNPIRQVIRWYCYLIKHHKHWWKWDSLSVYKLTKIRVTVFNLLYNI